MLTLSNVHKPTITIDDEPVIVHVKRLSKAEAIAFERDFFKFGQPRGSAERTEQEAAEMREFLETSIIVYVTAAPGRSSTTAARLHPAKT